MAKKKLHWWRIVDEAIEAAIEELGVNPERAKRLVAQREA
jgi:hypothetical protein